MKMISQRELRNHVIRRLQQVEAGERMRITVDGRPVADLVPIGGVRRTFVPRNEVLRLLACAPLDRKFSRDIEGTAGATIEESLMPTRTAHPLSKQAADEMFQFQVEFRDYAVGAARQAKAWTEVIFDSSRQLSAQHGKNVVLLIVERVAVVEVSDTTIELEPG